MNKGRVKYSFRDHSSPANRQQLQLSCSAVLLLLLSVLLLPLLAVVLLAVLLLPWMPRRAVWLAQRCLSSKKMAN